LITTTASYEQSNVKDKLKSVILGNSSEIKREKINLPAILIATPLIATPANLILNNGSGNRAQSSSVRVKREVRAATEGESESDKEVGGKRRDVSKVERNRAAAKRYR
jgi:hypothetical protein